VFVERCELPAYQLVSTAGLTLIIVADLAKRHHPPENNYCTQGNGAP
jgi:hypothetical protein